jgi:hypothetical protein
METALFNNRVVTVAGFLRARTAQDSRAICPACGEEVFLSAARSVKKTASFNHLPRENDEDRCSLSYPYHPSYAWLKDVDLEAVQRRAETLKATFYQLDNLKRAFTFLTTLTGKGAVSRDVFGLLLMRADKFDIWRYAGLPVWAVPYILLTFTDFYIRRPSKPTYVVRFIIDKPSRSKLNATWLQPNQCTLSKYFVNKGKATKLFGKPSAPSGTGAASASRGRVANPLPFSEAEYKQLTSDTSWISSGLDNLLAEMAMDATEEAEEDSAVKTALAAIALKAGGNSWPAHSRDKLPDAGADAPKPIEPVSPAAPSSAPPLVVAPAVEVEQPALPPAMPVPGNQRAQHVPKSGSSSTERQAARVGADESANKHLTSPESTTPGPLAGNVSPAPAGMWARLKSLFYR